MEHSHELARKASFRRYVALLVAGVALGPMAPNYYASAEALENAKPRQHSDTDWKRDWKDDFVGDSLSGDWKVMDNTSVEYERFAQYRAFAVTVRGSKLVITSRRHCVAPGEDVSLANAQEDPCPPGTSTEYSSGRVEQVIGNITGDYRVDVKARAPREKGARVAIWMNNIEDDRGGLNGGYCIEGSETPTKELDLYEGFGDPRVRASHHAFCKDGDTAEISRVAKFTDGWMKRAHVYSVEKVGRSVTFSADGELLPIRGSRGQSFVDKPRDFPDVTLPEYLQADAYPQGMIFDTRVFDDPDAASRLFRPPDPTVPFAPKKLFIDWIKKYSLDGSESS